MANNLIAMISDLKSRYVRAFGQTPSIVYMSNDMYDSFKLSFGQEYFNLTKDSETFHGFDVAIVSNKTDFFRFGN